jgi:hypothetical protein
MSDTTLMSFEESSSEGDPTISTKTVPNSNRSKHFRAATKVNAKRQYLANQFGLDPAYIPTQKWSWSFMVMYVALHVDDGSGETPKVLQKPTQSALLYAQSLRPTFASALKAILATCDLYAGLLPHQRDNSTIAELLKSLQVTADNTFQQRRKAVIAHTSFSIQEELQANRADNLPESFNKGEACASAYETIRNAASLKSCTPEYKCPLATALDNGDGGVIDGAQGAVCFDGPIQRHIFLARDGAEMAMTGAVFELNKFIGTITVHMCTSPHNCPSEGNISLFPALCHQIALKFGDISKYKVKVLQFDTPVNGKSPVPGEAVPDYWAAAFLISRLFLYHTPFFNDNDVMDFNWPGFFTSDVVVRNTVLELLMSCDISGKGHKRTAKIGRRFGVSQNGNSFASIAHCVAAVTNTVGVLTRSHSRPTSCRGRIVSSGTLELAVGVERQQTEWLSKFKLEIDETILSSANHDDGVQLTKHILQLLKRREYLCGLHHPHITFPAGTRKKPQVALLVLSDSDDEEVAGYQHVGTPVKPSNPNVRKRTAVNEQASIKIKLAKKAN